MRLELVPREAQSRLRDVLTPVLSLVVALVIGGVIVWIMGRSPWRALQVYIVEPLLDPWALQEILVKAAPLILVATGLAFCFRADRWNIGAEGQFVMGGLAGGWLAVVTHGGPQGFWLLPSMLLLGALAGAAYGAIPALLRNRFGVSEILTSLMLVYVAELTLDYMVRGPLRDPKGFNFPTSAAFSDAASLPLIAAGGRLHAGILFALAAALIAAFVFRKTLFGFSITVAGAAPRAAGFAGFSEKRMTLAVFLISGGLAGLAGIIEVSGQIKQLQPSISPGYGFTGIIVAFLGRLSPVGIVLAGLILALIAIGSETAQVLLKLPLDLARVFQGILLFCILAGDVFSRYRLKLLR